MTKKCKHAILFYTGVFMVLGIDFPQSWWSQRPPSTIHWWVRSRTTFFRMHEPVIESKGWFEMRKLKFLSLPCFRRYCGRVLAVSHENTRHTHKTAIIEHIIRCAREVANRSQLMRKLVMLKVPVYACT